MKSILDYSNLIAILPVNNQSSIIKKDVWEKFSYNEDIKAAIFGNEQKIEISRADIHSECNTIKKIVMTLMWGYPTGGRGRNIENTLEKIDELNKLLSQENGKNIAKNKANDLIAKLANFQGLGISTWSKLLYFFNLSVNSKKCQIYDLKIVDSLNKKQFRELGTQQWKQNINHYYQYIELMDSLASRMKVLPEQVELFLFYYNLYYKFTV